MQKELTGRHVAIIVCSMFAVIIAVNLTLAFQAVATFPGLEVKNSYVASQNFDSDRAAQEALGWDVSAVLDQSGTLRLTFGTETGVAQPDITYAVLGRATNVAQDVTPDFTFDGQSFVSHVDLGEGNWNLRLVALAEDGTEFKQRVIVKVLK
ncbi:FixH family protein [Oceaniglobus ichthyenteri]|uniref:FixH family protein n=1 Tax=Oceaniglobus ichthyenteri TaxID=2136177 RepID=UPI000D3B37E9|nr:FixH family protein [Oceaniglobus ichthyenteri]